MSRAEDLFRRIEANGLDALDRILADLEPESLFLDFKRSNQDGVGDRLHDDDRKNLSKGISGFANSEGGLLIWGIACDRDRTTGVEVVEKRPLADAAGFRTKLEGAISRETIPPHPAIKMVHIIENGNLQAGYVVVLVSRSLIGPMRSVKTNHYHMRTGSDFSIVSHDVLAGMFGRSPQPLVAPNFVSRALRYRAKSDDVEYKFDIAAVNFGAVLASKIYLSLDLSMVPGSRIALDPLQRDHYPARNGQLPVVNIVASDGVELPPGGIDDLCRVEFIVKSPLESALVIKGVMGAKHGTPYYFTLSITPEAAELALQGVRNGNELQTLDILTKDLPEPR